MASEYHSVPLTCDHKHHDFLPYFYGNMPLKSKYQGIISESSGERKTAPENDLKLLNDVLASTLSNEDNEFFTDVLPVDSPAINLMKILGQQDCSIAYVKVSHKSL